MTTEINQNKISRRKLVLIITTVLIILGVAGYFIFQANTHTAHKTSPHSASKTKPKQTPKPASQTATPPPSQPISRCTSPHLSLSLGPLQGSTAKPQYYRNLILTNTSSTACTLGGYPGVSLLDSHGAQLNAPAERSTPYNLPVQNLTVGAGQPVYANITFLNHEGYRGACAGPVASIRVYPPGETQALIAPAPSDYSDYSCPGPGFRVSPLTLRAPDYNP